MSAKHCIPSTPPPPASLKHTARAEEVRQEHANTPMKQPPPLLAEKSVLRLPLRGTFGFYGRDTHPYFYFVFESED